jgi:hypothetical protein
MGDAIDGRSRERSSSGDHPPGPAWRRINSDPELPFSGWSYEPGPIAEVGGRRQLRLERSPLKHAIFDPGRRRRMTDRSKNSVGEVGEGRAPRIDRE